MKFYNNDALNFGHFTHKAAKPDINLKTEDIHKKQGIFSKYILNDPIPNASLILFIKNQDSVLKNAFNVMSYCYFYLETKANRNQANMETT